DWRGTTGDAMSALPPKADGDRHEVNACYGPKRTSVSASDGCARASQSYLFKRLTTATATIATTTTSAHISSSEIVSRPQLIICAPPFQSPRRPVQALMAAR